MMDSLPKQIRRMTAGPASAGTSSHIPDDILFFQILILLPVKCLVRFQSVSKLWHTTIISTHFVRCHLEHSKTRPSTLIIPCKHHMETNKFSLEGVNFYGFQPGQSNFAELILEKRCPGGIPIFSNPCSRSSRRIFVCNPATREFVELPQGSPYTAGGHVAFGFDPWSGKYKVARHFFRSYSESEVHQAVMEGTTLQLHGHEILTIGDGVDAWKWKATMDPPYAINARTPICLPGFFYWSARHSVTGHVSSQHVILRFSLHDETFTVHPNPPCKGFLSINDMLCELGGKLCYLHSSWPHDVAIWLAEDGPNLAWSQRCNVTLPIPRTVHVFPCASTDKDKIFLSIDACYILKCDMRNGSLEEIIDMDHDMVYDHGNGTKFCTGKIGAAHYMVPSVESLLRIRPW